MFFLFSCLVVVVVVLCQVFVFSLSVAALYLMTHLKHAIKNLFHRKRSM